MGDFPLGLREEFLSALRVKRKKNIVSMTAARSDINRCRGVSSASSTGQLETHAHTHTHMHAHGQTNRQTSRQRDSRGITCAKISMLLHVSSDGSRSPLVIGVVRRCVANVGNSVCAALWRSFQLSRLRGLCCAAARVVDGHGVGACQVPTSLGAHALTQRRPEESPAAGGASGRRG